MNKMLRLSQFPLEHTKSDKGYENGEDTRLRRY